MFLSAKIKNKTRMSTLATSVQPVLEVLSTNIRQKNKIKGIPIGKQKVELSLFESDIILHA